MNVMDAAGFANNRELINFAVSMGSRDWRSVLFGACQGNHLQLIEEVLSRQGENAELNEACLRAAMSGDRKLVEFLFEKGANDPSYSIEGACNFQTIQTCYNSTLFLQKWKR